MPAKSRQPRILVDTREKNWEILNILLAKPEGIDIGMKSGGPGDYIIVDQTGEQWGIEYKSFLDCFSSIIERDVSTDGRIYGQLAQLKEAYGNRAILCLQEFKYLPRKIKIPESRVKQMVYTFFSERSFVMPTILVRDEAHMAFLLKKLAKNLPSMEFHGRGYKVIAL